MADDESWLYGEEQEEEKSNGTSVSAVKVETVENEAELAAETAENPETCADGDDANEKQADKEGEPTEEAESPPPDKDQEKDSDDEDSDDDGLMITIDQTKIDEAKSSYTFGIKNPSLARHPNAPGEKKGKFSVEEFEQVQNINGVPAHEVDLEQIDGGEKPWKKPGADITDYFNYGFTEETWQAYCQRQKRMRTVESGVGMPGLPGQQNPPNPAAKPAPTTTIPTLGGGHPPKTQVTQPITPVGTGSAAKSTTIAVMTHDKREYSKKVFDQMDFSVPPPGMPPNIPPPGGIPTVGGGPPPMNIPPPHFNGPPPDFAAAEDPFGQDYGGYSGGYEPTMEAQWSAPPPSGGDHRYQDSSAPPGDRDYDDRDSWRRDRRSSRDDRRDYDRKRRRSRSRSRDRDRSYRRSERSERSSRRSRSKSPSSHKHKKSKKEKREKDRGDREVKKEPEDRD